MIVRLTKTGGSAGVCVFGRLEKGSTIDVSVPARLGEGEQEAKIHARKIFERDHADENPMEWEAEIVPEAGSMSTGDGLGT
jgi:hypothetical protein